MQNEIINLYKSIINMLVKSIPEKWESINLYASVLKASRGEMYFYYFPKKLIKSKPINCYQITRKFGIDEDTYNINLNKIYEYIKKLNEYAKIKWTNITIIIKNGMFTIEYHYDDIEHSKYTEEQRHLIWSYRYLNIPIDSINQKDKVLIKTYKEESKIRPFIYVESIKNIEIATNHKETKEHVKNQILKC